jgi:hypothetical protein
MFFFVCQVACATIPKLLVVVCAWEETNDALSRNIHLHDTLPTCKWILHGKSEPMHQYGHCFEKLKAFLADQEL